jgi:hypothetical protein
MKKTPLILLTLITLVVLTACGGREEGETRYGAGGGQSLREGSTAPYHSDIAQDQTYQTVLGLNILLYPPPVDDPKFEALGKAHIEDLIPVDFVAHMREAFAGEMGDEPVYEPVVEALQDDPLIADIQSTIYGGDPVQVGWVYGNNDTFETLEYNGVTVTLITADPIVLFAASQSDIDTETWTIDAKAATAFYIPEVLVVELNPDTMRSFPIRVLQETGYLVAVVTPAGVGLEDASPGNGMDQALVANDRWVFGFPDTGYYTGLTGSSVTIEPAD